MIEPAMRTKRLMIYVILVLHLLLGAIPATYLSLWGFVGFPIALDGLLRFSLTGAVLFVGIFFGIVGTVALWFVTLGRQVHKRALVTGLAGLLCYFIAFPEQSGSLFTSGYTFWLFLCPGLVALFDLLFLPRIFQALGRDWRFLHS